MKLRRWSLLLAVLLLLSFALPVFTVHAHMSIDPAVSATFPASINGYDILLKNSDALPTTAFPALGEVPVRGVALWIGLALFAISVALMFSKRSWSLHLSMGFALAAVGVFFNYTYQVQRLGNSLMFTLLLDEQFGMWLPAICAIIQAALVLISMKGREQLRVTDMQWRRVSSLCCVIALAFAFLPSMCVRVPDTLTGNPADAKYLNRSLSSVTEAIGGEPLLSSIAAENGAFQNVLDGELGTLVPLSNDATNIAGTFSIKQRGSTTNVMFLFALFCLLLAAVLQLFRKVDRWFPACVASLGAVLLIVNLPAQLTSSSSDLFVSATRQLAYLGFGYVSLFPVITVVFAAFGALTGVLSIRYAESPYFVNPVPETSRMRLTAVALAALALVFMVIPNFSVNFVKPGKNKVQNTVTVSVADTFLFRQDEALLSPATSKGKALYSDTETAGFTAQSVRDTMGRVTRLNSFLSWAGVLLCVGSIWLLLRKRDKKLVMTLVLMALAVRVLAWIVMQTSMPEAVGSIACNMPLFVTMPLLVFAAFFSNFADKKELPKKYKLFLLMLPFLVAVFLFSYLPLYGWSYAFYNYKFGIPMNDQEFVGFKWFTELVTNFGHRANMVRVMGNTFAMSGLSILTSWMPMVFAILLNEVTRTRFKKFVQIFTTLPNFISWALVFSFAMAMFAMDTGIYSKFMLGIGAIDKPVAWLNSNEHIWIKMWAWNTWKGLGWGAIMYLAAIAGIDQELYEAARVDGAGRWNQMRFITLPSLLPTFFVLLLLSISNIINNGMEQYLVFQNPMNKSVIEVLDLYVYNITSASTSSDMYSFGTAIGILKTLFSVTLLFLANFASKNLRGESIV